MTPESEEKMNLPELPENIIEAIDRHQRAFFRSVPSERVKNVLIARTGLVQSLREWAAQQRVTPEGGMSDVLKIVRAGIEGDVTRLRAYAELLASRCEPSTATRLRRVIAGDNGPTIHTAGAVPSGGPAHE